MTFRFTSITEDISVSHKTVTDESSGCLERKKNHCAVIYLCTACCTFNNSTDPLPSIHFCFIAKQTLLLCDIRMKCNLFPPVALHIAEYDVWLWGYSALDARVLSSDLGCGLKCSSYSFRVSVLLTVFQQGHCLCVCLCVWWIMFVCETPWRASFDCSSSANCCLDKWEKCLLSQ